MTGKIIFQYSYRILLCIHNPTLHVGADNEAQIPEQVGNTIMCLENLVLTTSHKLFGLEEPTE